MKPLLSYILGILTVVCIGAYNGPLISKADIAKYMSEKHPTIEWLNDDARRWNKESPALTAQGITMIKQFHTVFNDNKELGFREDGAVVWRIDEKD